MNQLHLIASAPDASGRHINPDATARMLSEHPTRDAAVRAGRDYLRANPTAWLQIDDGQGGSVEDVTPS